jgi:hypothetical protein
MAKRGQLETPAELLEASQRFEDWRSSHSGRRPIPETLWSAAAELAREHGVFRTAKVLRLDYSKLKKQMMPTQPKAKPPTPPAFVELIAPESTTTFECTIEVEGPRGRMRIEWKGTTAPDLAGLSRAFWEPGA